MAVATGEAIEFSSAEEARAVIGDALELADRDPEIGPVLRAIDLRQRIELTDLGLTVSLRTSDSIDRYLEWSFADDPGYEPRLTLRMSGATANRLLQGCESTAIGIARGAIEVTGSSRAALAFLPALRRVARCYGSVVRDSYPHLLCSR